MSSRGFYKIALCALALACPRLARADVFRLDVLGPKVEAFPTSQIPAGTYWAVESFDEQPASSASSAFWATFPARSPITGTYSGNLSINNADLFGGAGGTGRYAATYDSTGYTLTLGHSAAIPGVNYFGLALSALDPGNTLDFLSNGRVIYTYNAASLVSALGTCGAGNAYCGNPTTGQDGGEQFAFLGITDTTGFFDQVRFREIGYAGGFESDNHTVAYVKPTVTDAGVPIPEPVSAIGIGAGLLGLGVYRMLRRQPDDLPTRLGDDITGG